MKKNVLCIALGAALFVLGLVLPEKPAYLRVAALLAAYAVLGADIVWRAIRNILRGKVFDENFLMALATLGAFAIGEYPEGVAVMLFYQVGEAFQGYAVDRSRRSIASLMDIRPDFAVVRRNGLEEKVSPEEVGVGETILVRAGERIPLDGTVTSGSGALDTSALTGESMPREVKAGDEVLSGCINLSGTLSIETVKGFGESTVSKILDLVENAAGKKSASEAFITRFAAVYTPAVVVAALLLAVLPPLFIKGAAFSTWLYRALAFLVVSCPCALVISIPLSFFGGIGGASRAGILVKGGNYLEALARTEHVVFDKTGTLTKGVFEVREVSAANGDADALLELAAYAESYSNHPIALSLRRAYKKDIDSARVEDAEEISGHGVRARVHGKTVLAGSLKLMEREGVAFEKGEYADTVVHISVDGAYAGHIRIADALKDDAKEAIQALRDAGVRKTAMLTGDSAAAAQKAAGELGITEVYAELLPLHKVEKLEALLRQKTPNATLAFVGDGINDAPVLARADIGIAMGGLGSDAAIEAADVVIMTDEPSKLAAAMRIAKKTLRIATQNTVFAIGVKAAVLLLSALGYASMWSAVFADVGVSVLAILNALRALGPVSTKRPA